MTISDKTVVVEVVAACTNDLGLPGFAYAKFLTTTDKITVGAHYEQAKEHLLDDGYEPPFVCFDTDDLPLSLFAIIKQHIGVE